MCDAVFPDASQTPQQIYERIELPPVRPDVTQIRLFGGRCACCGERATAEAPAGLEPGSPFGQSIAAMVVYLHYSHAIGMERLVLLMDELFSLSISEGAICNILARARGPLLDASATIERVVVASPVICSDETSVRVKGKNWWEWVFIGTLAVLHTIQPSRGKAVVTALFGETRPLVWVSDMLGSQRGHGVLWQVCLAHLLRDAAYAIECGDTAFSTSFRRLLLRAIAIGRRRETLKDATLKQYLYDLDRRLDRIMAAVPVGQPGRKLHKRMLANRAYLFVFMTNRAVPYTNNVSERHLRPSVIFRKVTNGFRCEWGAETYAAFRSVVSTAKANRASVLDTVSFVLSAKRTEKTLLRVG
jgi:transposase